MPPRSVAAATLRVALTFSCAVLVHGVVHAAGSGSFAWDSPAHAAMLAAAAACLAAAGFSLGLFAPGGERRRRLALIRAALPRAGALTLCTTLATQALVAGSLFALEGSGGFLDPGRIAAAIVCGLIALLLTTALCGAHGRRVVALLAEMFARRERPDASRAQRLRVPARVRTSARTRLFIPNRPPPLAA